MVDLCSIPWWNSLQEKPVGGEGSIPSTGPGQIQHPTGQGKQHSEELSQVALNPGMNLLLPEPCQQP